MSTELTTRATNALALPESDMIATLKASLYPGAKDDSVRMVLAYCRAGALDPMTKPVHIVPMWDKNSNGMRDVVMPGIELYRVKAARTGQYAGCSEPEFGPTVTTRLGNRDVTHPEWCRMTVRRLVSASRVDAPIVAEFTAVERWLENYAQAGKDPAPNAMWTKRPWAQLAKCAEAQALRKGFPEVGAAPTADEMAGKSIDPDSMPVIDAGPPPELLTNAQKYASRGRDAFLEHWSGLAKDQRDMLRSHLGALQAAAQAADNAPREPGSDDEPETAAA